LSHHLMNEAVKKIDNLLEIKQNAKKVYL
jgi:hypothetical protein